jgi:hypothetical protein
MAAGDGSLGTLPAFITIIKMTIRLITFVIFFIIISHTQSAKSFFSLYSCGEKVSFSTSMEVHPDRTSNPHQRRGSSDESYAILTGSTGQPSRRFSFATPHLLF